MRVAYVVSDLGGGTGHHLLSLLNQPEVGWRSVIVSEQPNTSRFASPVPTYELPSLPESSRFPISQVRRWRQIRTLMHDESPDLIHSYFFWSIIYGRLLKAQGIVRHIIENREDMGFSWGKMEYGLLSSTRTWPDRVICVSDAVRDSVLRGEKLPPERVEVVRNGLGAARDPAPKAVRALTDELGIRVGDPVVGMVANFNRPVKGAHFFVEAIPLVAARFPRVRFVLVGTGSNPRELESRAAELGVLDRFVLAGFRRDMDTVYGMLDVSVLTSLSEGLSITILESMRAELPVVVTNVGGNPELVVNGETGYLVPPANPEALAAGIIALLADPNLRKRMGRAGAARAATEFSLASVAARYGQIYREVVEGP